MLYVRNEANFTLTSNELGAKRFELTAKGNVGSIKVLPVDVALRDGFARAWAAGKVTVSQNADFSNPVTSVPADESVGPNATTTAAGNVKVAAAQANTSAADLTALKADFNSLLAKLRAAGILAP